MARTEVENELREAVKLKGKIGEKRQDYLYRLINEVDSLADSDYDKLSEGAKRWCESAATAGKAKKSIPDFESAADDAKPAKTKKAAPAAAKKGDTKTGKVAREAKPRGALPPGRNKHVQEVLAKNPNASIDEIIEELQRKNVPIPSRFSISTSRSSFRSAMETLNRMGLLKHSVQL